MPSPAEPLDELADREIDGVGQLGLQAVSGPPGGGDRRPMGWVALRHVVEALVDGQELLRDMPVGDRDHDRWPAAWEHILVEQAAHRMRPYGWGELGVAEPLEVRRTHLAMPATSRARLKLVEVMEQGGDLDEGDVERYARSGDELGGLACHASHAFAVNQDAVGKSEVEQQLAGGGERRDGHGPMVTTPRGSPPRAAVSGRWR